MPREDNLVCTCDMEDGRVSSWHHPTCPLNTDADDSFAPVAELTRQRDEARAQAEDLAEALDELLIGGSDAVSMEYAKRAAKVVLRSYRKARDDQRRKAA